VGDMLSVQSLIRNPLDWHHFYDKISTIKKGAKTDFIVVTDEGDRIAGSGEVIDMEKWSNHGHFGFKIKIKIKKQKSSSDRRIRPIYSTVQQTNVSKQVADKELEIPNIRQPLST
jgi:endo-alpha-1,4-polygalactosaminidase (GH114 family)